uniref:maleylacetate reductase n=1 Tax=Marinobacterium nitratireducens TaxID=518897 RepID=UPI003570DA18
MDFHYQINPGRIIFGAGKLAQAKAEAEALGMRRVLVLSTPQQRPLAEDLAARLGDIAVGIYDQAVMHVPVETVADVMGVARKFEVDGCAAIGGGSTIGLAKAIALETDLPILAIPTTYAGSEMTPVWGLTRDGLKTTGRDTRVLPKTVIYDPELTLELPDFISGPSGMNAIAHCVEGLYSQSQNPVTSLMAEEGIRALAQSLPVVVRTPGDIEARAQALYGAWLAGTVLGTVGMAIHHKLCHTLGGSFNLPHAEVHTVVIPQATAFNQAHAPKAMAAIGRALGVKAEDAAPALFDLALSLGAPVALKDIGMKESDLEKAAGIATTNPYYNPRPVIRDDVLALLHQAYDGIRPSAAAI